MSELNSKNIRVFANFLNRLAKDMTRFYYSKLNKPFKVDNKLKGKGYDPVTSSDIPLSTALMARRHLLKLERKHAAPS